MNRKQRIEKERQEVARATVAADPYKEWRKTLSMYPPDHTERVKYEAIMA